MSGAPRGEERGAAQAAARGAGRRLLLECWTHGVERPAAAAALVRAARAPGDERAPCCEEQRPRRRARALPEAGASQHAAAYAALQLALDECAVFSASAGAGEGLRRGPLHVDVRVMCSSELVARQWGGEWRAKGHLKELLEKAKAASAQFGSVSVVFCRKGSPEPAAMLRAMAERCSRDARMGSKRRREVGESEEAGDGDAEVVKKRAAAEVSSAAPLPSEMEEAGLEPAARAALRATLRGEHVFLSGAAGSGKSVLTRRLVRALRASGRSVAVTAPTGIAALNVSGRTLHSWAGIRDGSGDREALLGLVVGQRRARKRWTDADVLLIDEVSMLSGELFDKLDFVGRRVRGDLDAPFGGLQVVAVGDFLQLPPVPDPDTPPPTLAFESTAWAACGFAACILRSQHRQASDGDDGDFVRALSELRLGVVSAKALEVLSRARTPPPGDCIRPTVLSPYRTRVQQTNDFEFRKLPGACAIYTAADSGDNPEAVEKAGPLWQAPEHLRLKEGAQVVLLANLDLRKGLCNGSRGRVVGFAERDAELLRSCKGAAEVEGWCGAHQRLPVVRFGARGDFLIDIFDFHGEEVRRRQLPLALGWALTIHKSQGMSLDCLEVDASQAFAEGMVYVALSRARSLAGLHLTGFDPQRVAVSEPALRFYERAGAESEHRVRREEAGSGSRCAGAESEHRVRREEASSGSSGGVGRLAPVFVHGGFAHDALAAGSNVAKPVQCATADLGASPGFGAWEAHSAGVGSRMLQAQGWAGQGAGLGKAGQGRAEPVVAVMRPKRLGIGGGGAFGMEDLGVYS